MFQRTKSQYLNSGAQNGLISFIRQETSNDEEFFGDFQCIFGVMKLYFKNVFSLDETPQFGHRHVVVQRPRDVHTEFEMLEEIGR